MSQNINLNQIYAAANSRVEIPQNTYVKSQSHKIACQPQNLIDEIKQYALLHHQRTYGKTNWEYCFYDYDMYLISIGEKPFSNCECIIEPSECSDDIYGNFSEVSSHFYGHFDSYSPRGKRNRTISWESNVSNDFDYYNHDRKPYICRPHHFCNIFDDVVPMSKHFVTRSKFIKTINRTLYICNNKYKNTKKNKKRQSKKFKNCKVQTDSADQSAYEKFYRSHMMRMLDRRLYNQIKDLDPDYVPKLVDDIITFVQMATMKVENMTFYEVIVLAVRVFFKSRYNESSGKLLFKRLFPYIKNIFSGLSVQGDFFETSRSFLNSYKNINESPIVLKLYKCCTYLMTMSVFEKIGITFESLGYSKLEEVTLKKKFYKKTDFIYVLCDTILFILERGYQVYVTQDIGCLFHSGGTYKDLYEDCRLLTRQNQQLHNPEANGFTESDYRNRLDTVIEKLQNISKHSFRLDKSDVNIVKCTLNDMLMMRDDLNTKSAARQNRKAPFGLLIFGDSGIGKTTITSMMATFFAKHEKLPSGAEFRYTVNPAAKYWDGFLTSQHTVILDDIANESPELGDPGSLNVVIQTMNNQAFCPDQASLEMKGTTPFRGKLVIATTNVKNLNAYHYFSCPSAIQRRFPFIITPTVKKEFLNERNMLDSEKVPTDQPYPDLWFFKVELVRPTPIDQGKHYAKIETVLENANIRELLQWYHTAIVRFNEDQVRVENCNKLMLDTELCLCCNLPDTLCQLRPQGYVDNIENTGYFIMGFMCCLTVFSIIWALINSRPEVQKIRLFISYYSSLKRNIHLYQIRQRELLNRYIDVNTWTRMGERMKDELKQPRIFLTLTIAITSFMTFYKMYNKLTPQGDVSADIGTRPLAEINGRENVWYNNTLDVTVANFSRESSSSKSVDFTQFCAKIAENVCHISIKSHKTCHKNRGRMVALGGHIYLTNNHNVPDLSEGGHINVVFTHSKGVNSNSDFCISESDVHRIPYHDLCFLTLRSLPPKKRIVQYIQKGKANGIFNGMYINRSETGQMTMNPVKKIQLLPERKFTYKDINLEAKHAVWTGKSDERTQYGDCGMPLLINSSYGYCIVGLHFLANEMNIGEIYATHLDGNFIEKIYNSLNSYNVSAGNFSMVSSKSKERPVAELHKKSVFRFLPEGSVNVYGSFTDFRGKSGSSVELTPMNKFLKEKGYETKFTKPEMKSWAPWHIAAKDLVKPINTLDTGILDLCAQSYINDVLKNIDETKISSMMHVLDDFTAINGAQVAYIDKINRNTSAGNPWKMSKKYFMETIPPAHGMLDPVIVNDEIMDRVDEIINKYKANEQAHPNFCAHLKDEPVSFKKASVGKTRVFTGAPFDWTIVVRKYLLSFTRLLQNERLAFEAAPGTIAQSVEWQEMYDYITKNGEDNIVAGDYEMFDKKMTPKEILLAFDIIIFFCKLSGNYTDEDIQIIRCIAEDTAFALVDYNGDLVQLYGSNPSGNPLTVILNGIVNSLRVRYVYYLTNPKSTLEDFKENVSLMTYGDDNIMSVKSTASWFNHTAIADCFASLGIGYTMADKEAKSVPFINIKDASFLKRTWRFEESLGCMVAPLDHKSIEKMLMVWNRSKSVTEEAQGISVISTALREYFFYGREIFEEKSLMFKKLIKDLHWDLWVEDSTFPTFDELCENFKRSSRHCDSFEVYFPVGV